MTTSNYLGKLSMLAAAALVASVLVLFAAVPTQAAFPGGNGKITVESDRDGDFEVYSMDPGGSNPTNLTHNALDDQDPAWSPDGSRIAFRSSRNGNAEVYTMGSGGADQLNRSRNAAIDREPDWQPIPRCTLTGTTADDRLVGNAGKDVICGRGGDDILTGRGGDDILWGGEGNDTVRGGAQDDILNGGAGKDTASYESIVGATMPVSASLTSNFATGEGSDLLSFIENLTGTGGDDTLRPYPETSILEKMSWAQAR